MASALLDRHYCRVVRVVWLVIILLLGAAGWSAYSRSRSQGAESTTAGADPGRAAALADRPAELESGVANDLTGAVTADARRATEPPASGTPTSAATLPSEPSSSATTAPLEGPPAPTADRAIPASAGTATSENGATRLDDRFIVRGAGTPADPMRIPWNLLISANETYDLAQKKTELPSRVTALSGLTVAITGYIAAGIVEDETSDILVMFNKWDGCCLGLPPTPFDAVEVDLDTPVKLRGQHMLRYGTVTGEFEVEPFIVGEWLVGLYRIRNARLEWGG